MHRRFRSPHPQDKKTVPPDKEPAAEGQELHQHPIKILKLCTNNFWLLLIPLVRGLVALRFDIWSWLRGAWVDLLVLLLIGGTAWLRWRCVQFSFNQTDISLKSGVFVKSYFRLPYENISVSLLESSFLLRPFRAVHVLMDTYAGLPNVPDLSLTLRQSDAEQLFSSIQEAQQASGMRAEIQASKPQSVLFSFVFSSTLSGVVLISTLFIQSSKIVGRALEERFVTAMNDVAAKLAIGLPPLAIGISGLLLFGWFLSFVKNLLRYMNFRISRCGDRISVHTGVLTTRHYFIDANQITYADLRQNLLMKFCFVMSVHVGVAGYGKSKDELPVLVPISTKKHIFSSLRLLLPTAKASRNGPKPPFNYLFRYIWLPLAYIAAAFLGCRVLFYFFPEWKPFLDFLLLMSEIPSIWFLLVKIIGFFGTRVSYAEDTLTLRFAKALLFHTLLIPLHRIVKVEVRQSVFQCITGCCDLRIYTMDEFSKPQRILCIPLEPVLRLLAECGLAQSKMDFFLPIPWPLSAFATGDAKKSPPPPRFSRTAPRRWKKKNGPLEKPLPSPVSLPGDRQERRPQAAPRSKKKNKE